MIRSQNFSYLLINELYTYWERLFFFGIEPNIYFYAQDKKGSFSYARWTGLSKIIALPTMNFLQAMLYIEEAKGYALSPKGFDETMLHWGKIILPFPTFKAKVSSSTISNTVKEWQRHESHEVRNWYFICEYEHVFIWL